MKLREDTGYYQRPYAHSGELGKYPAGTPVVLLSDLGDWWSVAIGEMDCFLPAGALVDLYGGADDVPDVAPGGVTMDTPADAPVYGGIYSDFRDMPFLFLWKTAPPMAFTDTEAWLALHDNGPALSHMAKQADGGWIETERINGLLGAGVRTVSDFTFDIHAEPMRLSIAYDMEDSAIQFTGVFEYTNGGWKLSSLQLQESEYIDAVGRQLLYDRALLPTADGLVVSEGGQTREVPLEKALALGLADYSAMDMLNICSTIFE